MVFKLMRKQVNFLESTGKVITFTIVLKNNDILVGLGADEFVCYGRNAFNEPSDMTLPLNILSDIELIVYGFTTQDYIDNWNQQKKLGKSNGK